MRMLFSEERIFSGADPTWSDVVFEPSARPARHMRGLSTGGNVAIRTASGTTASVAAVALMVSSSVAGASAVGSTDWERLSHAYAAGSSGDRTDPLQELDAEWARLSKSIDPGVLAWVAGLPDVPASAGHSGVPGVAAIAAAVNHADW